MVPGISSTKLPYDLIDKGWQYICGNKHGFCEGDKVKRFQRCDSVLHAPNKISPMVLLFPGMAANTEFHIFFQATD